MEACVFGHEQIYIYSLQIHDQKILQQHGFLILDHMPDNTEKVLKYRVYQKN